MPDALVAVLVIVAGYLLGSVPTAYLASRRHGVDVRTLGTGVAGANNVFRHVSKRAGVLVAAVDVAKGAIPVVLARVMDAGPWLMFGAGAAALVGHWWPVFSGFRGGKGAAAGVGAVAAVLPMPTLIAAPFALIALLWTHRPTPAVAALMGAAIVAALLLHTPLWEVVAAAGLSVMVLIRTLTWRNPHQSALDPKENG